MKRFLSLFLALSLCVSAQATTDQPGKKPLAAPVLQGTMSAAGHGITGLPGDNPLDVYITSIARTDGLVGTGTRTDQKDGSSQAKLDAIFKSYYDAGTTNVTFHLDAGTFQLKGAWDYSWAMLSGWKIKGAGKTATHVIQVVGTAGVTAGSNGPLFGPAPALNQDDMEVSDMWLDMAWFRSGPGGDNSRPHGNFNAAATWGRNGTLRNLLVTGCGWADNECFALLTSGGIGDAHIPDNALMENCEISNGGNINLTAMAMINLAALGTDSTPHYAHNGRIIGNLFNIPNGGNGSGPPAGYDSGSVTGNTAIASYHGMFADTFPSKNITISGNTFEATYIDGNGVLFNEGAGNTPYENITFIGNTVISSGGIGFGSAVKNSVISNNRIALYTGANADFGIYLNDATTQNISVTNNTIDTGLPYTVQNGATGWFWNNRDPAGALVIPDTNAYLPLLSSTVDNTLPRFNGTGGLLQPSGVAIDDTDRFGNLKVSSATTLAQTFATRENVLTFSRLDLAALPGQGQSVTSSFSGAAGNNTMTFGVSDTSTVQPVMTLDGFQNAKFYGLRIEGAVAPTVASAGTINPVKGVTFISGTAAISNITPYQSLSTTGGTITLIATGAWTTTTSGNIARALTASVGSAYNFTWDATAGKWYPLAGSTGAGTGDASTNTSTAVDGEVTLFSGTDGKTLKRATGSGVATITNGVLGTAAASNIVGLIDGTFITGKSADTTPDPAADYVMSYDASASALKKVKIADLFAQAALTGFTDPTSGFTETADASGITADRSFKFADGPSVTVIPFTAAAGYYSTGVGADGNGTTAAFSTAIAGTATNDSALPANFGYEVHSFIPVGSAVSLTTATTANVTSISLTAGDWDVRGVATASTSGVTTTGNTVAGLSATSASLPSNGTEVYSGVQPGAGALKNSLTLASQRFSLATTTTVYLVMQANFSAGTEAAFGAISARRVR